VESASLIAEGKTGIHIMRTIPMALTWELLTRGRRLHVLMTCAGLALPMLIYTALSLQGAIDPGDPAYIVIHLTMVQINVFVFGSGVMQAMGNVSRLYPYPARTSTLVAWQLLPAMAIVGVETLFSSVILNWLFDVRWPLWGPVLFSAVAFTAVIATMWLTEKSAWLPWALAIVGSVLGLWFKSRYGSLFDSPTYYWDVVTVGEVIMLAIIAVIAQVTAVYAVSRNRRGDTIPPLGVVAWFEQASERGTTLHGRFRSASDAHLWFEWRRMGWAMPAAVVTALAIGGSLWLIFNRDPKELLEALYIGGGVLIVLTGFTCGLLLGNTAPAEANSQVGHFLATRPMTNSHLAGLMLRTAAASVCLAWVLWIIPLGLAFGVVLLPGYLRLEQLDLFVREAWWYVPAMLLAAWTTCGVFASAVLSGRPQWVVGLLLGGFTTFIALQFTFDYTLTQEQKLFAMRTIFTIVCVVIALATAALFTVARRRELVTAPTAWGSLAAWGVLVAGLIVSQVLAPRLPEWPVTMCVSVSSAMALIFAPLAAAPLALSINRTR
jgi:hypothetical protein